MRICDRCKQSVDNLLWLEVNDGWNTVRHVWKFKRLEICKDCDTHFRKMRQNALCEAESRVCKEFLQEVRESIYENLR